MLILGSKELPWEGRLGVGSKVLPEERNFSNGQQSAARGGEVGSGQQRAARGVPGKKFTRKKVFDFEIFSLKYVLIHSAE